jgi:predicted SAM-dependent methyltransferase
MSNEETVTGTARINLGSGHWKLEGWVNVDIDLPSRPNVVADLGRGLPFGDGTAALMHTEDFIDQLTLPQAGAFLRECHRILAPGGVLRVLTPDLGLLASLYLEQPGRLLEMWNANVQVPLRLETAGEVFNLGMRFAGHTFLYDAETLVRLAADCGFEARQVSYNESEVDALKGLDLRTPENALSLYFDCYRLD